MGIYGILDKKGGRYLKKLLLLFATVLILSACSEEEKLDEVKKDTNKQPSEEAVVESEVGVELVDFDDESKLGTPVGVSDKDFSEITKSKPQEVRNDVTGNWRIIKIADNIPIEEYALSYMKQNMKEDEIHFIVNFNYKTTTMLSVGNGILYVEVKEYQDKEEHDAKELGGGMTLKEFYIYSDGEIRE